jgi:hypothetical protein
MNETRADPGDDMNIDRWSASSEPASCQIYVGALSRGLSCTWRLISI